MDNLTIVTTVVAAIYPAAIFLLPANIASKVNVVATALKAVAKGLEKAEKTPGGFRWK